MIDSEKVRDAAQAVKEIIQAVPVYQDAIQPAAKEIGTALSTVAKAVNLALAPLQGMIWAWDQIKGYLIPALVERLKQVPEERIITPAPNLAGPAIEALRFAGHESVLREMYANLLATAMDAKTAREAHPAFVEILKQLSPDEARIVRLLGESDDLPVISLIAWKPAPVDGYDVILRHFSLIGNEAGCSNPELSQSYLDNLCRLGLGEIPNDTHLARQEVYDGLKNDSTIKDAITKIDQSGRRPEILQEHFYITSLGKQFYSACVLGHDPDHKDSG